MNKKILILPVTFLLIIMFSNSIVGTVQAFGKGLTVEVFTTYPFVDPSTLTDMKPLAAGQEKYVLDGTIRIAHGSLREYDYEGPLGTGTFYIKSLHNKAEVGIPYSNLIAIGEGVYKYTLKIDEGPYGTGTLKGIGKLEYDFSIPDFRYEHWNTAKMVPVEGNLNIQSVSVEGYQFLFNWWWTTTIVVS